MIRVHIGAAASESTRAVSASEELSFTRYTRFKFCDLKGLVPDPNGQMGLPSLRLIAGLISICLFCE